MKPEQFTLKVVSRDGIPQALAKAEHYRLLNDPEQAESISRDILAVDAAHQATLRTLVLALTDQFVAGHAHAAPRSPARSSISSPRSTTAPTTRAWCTSARPARS